MENWIREIIVDAMVPRINQYLKNIDNNFGDPKAMKIWITQIEDFFKFIDGE